MTDKSEVTISDAPDQSRPMLKQYNTELAKINIETLTTFNTNNNSSIQNE